MQPRSRIRGRDPPSGGPAGGRYRRRSPPPPSPRHLRRPPQPQRRSPERAPPPPPPPRYDDHPLPVNSAADRSSRAGILLEAGRLAAHYLVAQGVLPAHLLRAREDPNHKPSPRHEPPAPYGRKLDDQDDTRSRRNAGEWGRAREDHDRQSRRSAWDRRSQSFDGRRKYNDAGDADRAARRTRDYEEPKRPPMSRSYSHNDRRPSADARLDRRRRSRSRSRSRSRTRSYHSASRRDSDSRAGARDFDHTKVPDSGIVHADGDEMPKQQRLPSSVVVAEADSSDNRPMPTEDGEMESEIIPLHHTQDISEDEEGEFAEDISDDEDGEFAAASLNGDEYGVEMDVIQSQLPDGDAHLRPSESVDEPVPSHSHLSDAAKEMEAGSAPVDACMIQPLDEDSGCTEARDEMEAPPPHCEVETSFGDLNRDEQELPAWYRIFDLSVVEAPDGCEITEIPGDPTADPVSDSVPCLVGQIHQQTKDDALETQGEDGHAGDNCVLGNGHDLNKYDLNNEAEEHAQDDTSEVQGQGEHAGDDHMLKDGHDLNSYDLNNEAVEDAHDYHLLDSEKLLLNHGMGVHDTDSFHLNNGQLLLNQNEDEHEQDDHRMESHLVRGEQVLQRHGVDGHHVISHQIESKVMLLPTGVRDLHVYDLNSEQMLVHDGVEKHALGSCHLTDGQMLFDRSADGQAGVRNMGNGRTIPVINLEDEEQSDTRVFL